MEVIFGCKTRTAAAVAGVADQKGTKPAWVGPLKWVIYLVLMLACMRWRVKYEHLMFAICRVTKLMHDE